MPSFQTFSFFNNYYRLFLLLNSIYYKIVIFFRNLLPIRYMYCIIGIIDFFFTNLLEVLPLFLLMRCHNMTLRRLVEFSLSYIVYETSVTCFFTYVYSPHLELLTSWWITILFLFCCVILRKNKVFLLRKLYWRSKHSFCSFSNKHMNCCFSSCYYTISILLNFLLKLWSFCSFRNISCA
jgi:hypothetical protein